MSYEITGKLIEKFNEQQVSERFKKREFVLEKEENGFTETIKFQLVQDKTDLIDPYQVGETIKVSFNIKGNKWKDNYFVNLNAWRVSREGGSGNSSSGMNNTPPAPDFSDAPPPPADDEMPF